MGNSESNLKYNNAVKSFSSHELEELKALHRSLSLQSKNNENYIITSVFQSYFGIHGYLGVRLFDVITQHRNDGRLYFEDLILAKNVYEKGSPDEKDEFIFSLLDLMNEGVVSKSNVECVVSSILETVLGPDQTVPDSSVDAFLRSAPFSQTIYKNDPKSDTGISAKLPSMSLNDFQEWCTHVPSIRKFLGSLLTPPSPGPSSRRVPKLIASEDAQKRQILRSEHAWHICGLLQDKEAWEWVLTYNSDLHGLSFHTFLNCTKAFEGASVLLIKDEGDFVFGGYASRPWERHSSFYGDMKCFLFSLLPSSIIYRASGLNSNLQWCAFNFVSDSIPNGVGFGGQTNHFGLFLDASFEKGHSRTCATFSNESLSSKADFKPTVIECWSVITKNETGKLGLDSKPTNVGTVLERFKEDKAMLNLVGIANSSDSVS